MRRIDQLIDLVRERTRNLNFSRDSSGNILEGISDNLILEYLNQAQDHLQAAILAVYPNEFIAEKTPSIVANQEGYTIADRVFVNNKIVTVECRSTSNLSDYYILDQGTFRDRDTDSGWPKYYIRKGSTILLNPIPSTSQGNLRIVYYRELDDIDIRRGTISSHTASATTLTALTLSTTGDDDIALADADYLCVNDRYGTVTMYNIPISSYASGTGVVTLVGGSFTFATGETIADSNYVTIGKYTTTHSKLPDNSERYLLLYAQKRILTTDESNTSVEEDAELIKIEQDIVNSFADESKDLEYIPILDSNIMW